MASKLWLGIKLQGVAEIGTKGNVSAEFAADQA